VRAAPLASVEGGGAGGGDQEIEGGLAGLGAGAGSDPAIRIAQEHEAAASIPALDEARLAVADRGDGVVDDRIVQRARGLGPGAGEARAGVDVGPFERTVDEQQRRYAEPARLEDPAIDLGPEIALGHDETGVRDRVEQAHVPPGLEEDGSRPQRLGHRSDEGLEGALRREHYDLLRLAVSGLARAQAVASRARPATGSASR
jgi:hypothetical protein